MRILACRSTVRRGDLPPARDAELCSERVSVRLGGAGRDPEPIGYLDIRAAAGDEVYDLALAVCESDVIDRQHERDRRPSAPTSQLSTRRIYWRKRSPG